MLQNIVSEDDEQVEAWYLLAYSLFKLKKYLNAEECCQNVKNLIIKLKIVDPELEAGTLEIYNEVRKYVKDIQKDEQEDDGFETVSEDEGSSENEEMKE